MSSSCREALPDFRELSRGHPVCPEVVWRHTRMSGRQSQLSGSGGRPLQMSGNGRYALLHVWEWTGGPLGCLGVVGRPSQMSGSD